MTGTKKQSTNRHVMFIATFLLAFALTSCSTSTKSTTKNASDVSQTTSAKSQSFNQDMSCDEHLAAAKQAHEIAAMHDEQYQTAKSKKRALSDSPPLNPYFAHDQSSAKKFKAEMDTHKREAERHTDLAQQHEIAIGALSPQELYTCLLSDFETPQSEQNETL